MGWNTSGTHAQEGDLAQLVGLNHKHFIIQLKPGTQFHTHRGILNHDDLIGKPWGCQVFSHSGSPFFLLQPAHSDLIRGTKRNTQILYPKDIGFIIITMGIGPGHNVIEAGTGSGSLTSALAFAVGSTGKIISYEKREEMQTLAKKNIDRLNLTDRVIFKLRDIEMGFDETNVDAVFLDLPNPGDYIPQVAKALKPGGFFGCLLPTVNQVSHLLYTLRKNHFAFIEVCELLLRYYKPEPARLRPTDRMVAHTGFLIFARPVLLDEKTSNQELLIEAGLVDENNMNSSLVLSNENPDDGEQHKRV